MSRAIKSLLVLLSVVIAACGGESGSSEPPAQTYEQAVINLTLVGGNARIGSVEFDLILPEGFTLQADTQGALLPEVLTVHAADSMVESYYLPEDLLHRGQLTLAIINVTGFATGPLAKVVRDMAPGELLPEDTGFEVSYLLVTDLDGVELTGLSVVISPQQQTLSR